MIKELKNNLNKYIKKYINNYQLYKIENIPELKIIYIYLLNIHNNNIKLISLKLPKNFKQLKIKHFDYVHEKCEKIDAEYSDILNLINIPVKTYIVNIVNED